MHCPKCENALSPISDLSFEASHCAACGGIWLANPDKNLKQQARAIEQMERADINAAKTFNQVKRIQCPNCDAKMISMVSSEQFHIEYEACPDCRGAFFDSGELSDLSDFTLSEQITQLWDTLKSNLRSS